MEWVIHCSVAAIIEFAKTFLFLYCVLDFKASKSYLRHIFCIIIYCAAVCFFYGKNNIKGVNICLNLIIPFLCFDETKLKKFFSHIIICFSISTIDAVILSLSLIVSKKNWELVNQDINILHIFLNSIGILFWVLIGIFRKRILIKKENSTIPNRYYIISILLLIINTFVIVATREIFIGLINERVINILILFVTIAGVLSVVLSFVFVEILNSTNYYKKLRDMNSEYLRIQESYYKKVYESQRSLRAFCHDLNSHMICIKELANEGDKEGLNNYIDEILKQKEKFSANIYSGNKIVDAVISDTLSQNINNDINIDFKGKLPEKLNILPYDLCTIFSNAIKNAVEACLKLDKDIEKRIDILVSIYKNNIGIVITNPTKEDINVKNGKILTSKKDKELHGFGTENIKKAVEKYGGDIQFKNENGKFVIDIILVNSLND